MTRDTEQPTHPDDIPLLTAIAGISARLPRLKTAAVSARQAYTDATLAAAVLLDSNARRSARADNQELCSRMLAKEAEWAAEDAALSTARTRLAEKQTARAQTARAAVVAAETKAAGSAVQALHDALAAVDTASVAFAEIWHAVEPAAVAAFARVPAHLRNEIGPEISADMRKARLKQRLIDLALANGFHSGHDKTLPAVAMVGIFDRSPALASLLPVANEPAGVGA